MTAPGSPVTVWGVWRVGNVYPSDPLPVVDPASLGRCHDCPDPAVGLRLRHGRWVPACRGMMRLVVAARIGYSLPADAGRVEP
jgi:hypothetical protein